MATEQAYAQMYDDDRLFVQMRTHVGSSITVSGGGEQMIHNMWKHGFSRNNSWSQLVA